MENVRNILLVEDNPLDTKLFNYAILSIDSDIEYKITQVKSLKEVDSFKHLKFDLIITDLNIQDSIGISTFKKIQKIFIDNPIIVLSSNVDKNIALESVRLGAQEFILKSSIEGHTLEKILNYAIERKKFELEKKEMKEKEYELSRKNFLTSLTGGAAHEINTPLGIILLESQIIKKNIEKYGNNDLDWIKMRINSIVNSTLHIKKIIKLLLQLSNKNLDEKKIDLNIKSYFLYLKKEVFCNLEIKEEEIEFVNNVSETSNIYISVQNVTLALLEIIKNSVENTKKIEGPKIKVELLLEDNLLKITVIDNGMGIDENNVKKIFDPFFSTKEIGEGLGLGLSIVKNIIDSHKGNIKYKRIDNQTCFIVTLPNNKI